MCEWSKTVIFNLFSWLRDNEKIVQANLVFLGFDLFFSSFLFCHSLFYSKLYGSNYLMLSKSYNSSFHSYIEVNLKIK